MKKYLIIALAVSLSFTVNAQFLVVLDNVSVQPISAKSLNQNTSNPYLYSETFKGKITLADNKQMENLDLLYDLILDLPVLVDAKGVFLKPNSAPLEFEMTTPEKGLQTYKRGYPSIAKQDKNTFYEVLADGKTQLLKKSKKSFTESIPYGTKDVVKEAIITEFYYLYEDGQMKKIAKDPKSLINVFNDKKIVLSKGLDALKTKFKNNEEIMIAIANQYNSSK